MPCWAWQPVILHHDFELSLCRVYIRVSDRETQMINCSWTRVNGGDSQPLRSKEQNRFELHNRTHTSNESGKVSIMGQETWKKEKRWDNLTCLTLIPYSDVSCLREIKWSCALAQPPPHQHPHTPQENGFNQQSFTPSALGAVTVHTFSTWK